MMLSVNTARLVVWQRPIGSGHHTLGVSAICAPTMQTACSRGPNGLGFSKKGLGFSKKQVWVFQKKQV
jgi:hypothetical protein